MVPSTLHSAHWRNLVLKHTPQVAEGANHPGLGHSETPGGARGGPTPQGTWAGEVEGTRVAELWGTWPEAFGGLSPPFPPLPHKGVALTLLRQGSSLQRLLSAFADTGRSGCGCETTLRLHAGPTAPPGGRQLLRAERQEHPPPAPAPSPPGCPVQAAAIPTPSHL